MSWSPHNSLFFVTTDTFSTNSRQYSRLQISDAFNGMSKKKPINQQKHGISFKEAESVFFDDYATQFWDEEYSDKEERSTTNQ